MKFLILLTSQFLILTCINSQTLNCRLTPLNSLDFFFDGPGEEIITWPDSTILAIENTLADSADDNTALQFIPLAMLEMKTYFDNGITQDGFYRIMRYSNLFAQTLNDSSWIITMGNFCNGTDQLINRFNSWYDNDSIIASLLYTTDRGPYYGKPFEVEDIDHIYQKDSIQFPNNTGTLYLGNYNDYTVIYMMNASGELLHVTRILEKYHEEDVRTLFAEIKCVEIKDFGYSVLVFVPDGVARLYFDKEGKLRFYFIM